MSHNAIFFDLDGVLWDTMSLHVESFNEVLSRFDLKVTQPMISGRKTSEIFAELFVNLNLQQPLEELIKEKQKLFVSKIKKNRDSLIDTELGSVIQSLKPSFYLGICTSGSKASLDLFFEISDMRKDFNFALTSNDISKGKPDPEIYLKALELSGADALNSLVIEDSVSGAQASHRANIEVIVFGNHKKLNLDFPHRSINRIGELIGLLT